ncbi:SDR family oxidoreductase [Methylocapsa polymorpha]|uniref:SDR family oxidoreductase n=1 Tax=Methylocapsa polymorpha TaxID=3080828 RepID=A0ABZ0HTU9_9HYPH|nr:SDR family oxidoreductase [Methylocapsa sp. RX1]
MRDKVVIVTGGFGALGRAVGETALAAGAYVALIGHGQGDSIAAHDRLLTIGEVDLTELAQVHQAFETVAARWGKIDGLANVAGGFRWQTLEGGDLAIWTELFRKNLLTAATAIKAALPYLRASGGAIVNVAAAPAENAKAGMEAYAASKAGVLRLTEGAADELKDAGVRVNAILPTIIDTPRNRSDMPKADFARWVKPDQIARTILFLLSEDASGITGAKILLSSRT